MLCAGDVSGTVKRELKKHLSAHLGKGFSLSQWGMQQRRQFFTVQDPLVCALAREKATSCNTHPDVLAQVDATDTGNKRNLPEKKADDISTRRKLQRDVGRLQRSNISLTPKRTHYHGRRYYSTMGRWIRTARMLTVWNIHVILKKNSQARISDLSGFVFTSVSVS